MHGPSRLSWLEEKSPGMCNGSVFLYNDHQRYCGLNLTIIATDNRAAWHLGTLFFVVVVYIFFLPC